tara:strand:+ start:643 stop:927 length:285 start_codon:yes stop_codon:yes gene_type:complete
MDKDESYANMEEALLSHNQDLEHQEQEENSNHVMQVIRDTNINMLGQCIDESKNVELLVIYAEEQKKLHRYNHYYCLKKAQEKMKLQKEKRNDR